MKIFNGFASLVLAAATVATLSAETHCPGNITGVPLQNVNHNQILVAVSVNHSGPYNFLLDTGAELTIVDPSLATELHLSAQGSANVTSAGSSASTAASFARVDLLEAGSHAVTGQTVLVFDFQSQHSANRPIRGILSEDFLGRFDVLIDNAHHLLCLDDAATMRASVKGMRIPLVASPQSTDSQLLPGRLIVAVRIPDAARPVLLKLDSGANVPLLYNVSQILTPGQLPAASLLGNGLDGTQRGFSVLPPQKVVIGSLDLPAVSFIARRGTERNSDMAELDGLLPTGLFRRVFIDHADRFAVLEQW